MELTDRFDSKFQATNTSSYNIYAKCYKGQGNSMVPNTGCEDEDGIITFLNDAGIQTKMHVIPGNWTVCNPNLRRNYHDGNKNGSEWIYKYLIQQKKYRIVLIRLIVVLVLGRSGQPCASVLNHQVADALEGGYRYPCQETLERVVGSRQAPP